MSKKFNHRSVRQYRKFDIEFKKKVVSEYEKGTFSPTQLSRMYDLQVGMLYKWIYKYSTASEKHYRIVEKHESPSEKLKEYEKRIADLERSLGQKQMLIDFYDKLIELAEEDLKVDIKKNIGSKLSSGSGKTNDA
jgi:transposase-like protein